jgi:hypothetical protein
VRERRPSNSELHLQQLEEQEQEAREERGILELFGADLDDADEPLERDPDRQPKA